MSTEDVTRQLEAVLALRGLPDSARERGRALFESLSRPVRLALLGKKQSGKTTVANLFLGQPLLPEGLSAEIIELVPGDAFAAEAEYPDGALEALEQDDLSGVVGAKRLVIAAPCPILRRVVLVEAGGSSPETVETVAKEADILLWCSPEFEPSERAIWEAMDSALRDHSFLILTKADKLARTSRLADVLAELKPTAQNDFAGLFPVAALQGLKAQLSKPRDAALWKGSGAGLLIDAVLDHARRGRQADLDQAELFLARYALEIDEDAEPGERPRSRIRTRPRSQMVRRRSRLTRPVTRPASREADSTQAPPQQPGTQAPEQPAAAIAPALETKARTSLAERLVDLRRTPSRLHSPPAGVADRALENLRTTGADLGGHLDDPRRVLDLCADAADRLHDLFSTSSLPAELSTVAEDVDRTVEMMTLLQLETGAGAAADAVTLLLQIRRDLEQRVAA